MAYLKSRKIEGSTIFYDFCKYIPYFTLSEGKLIAGYLTVIDDNDILIKQLERIKHMFIEARLYTSSGYQQKVFYNPDHIKKVTVRDWKKEGMSRPQVDVLDITNSGNGLIFVDQEACNDFVNALTF